MALANSLSTCNVGSAIRFGHSSTVQSQRETLERNERSKKPYPSIDQQKILRRCGLYLVRLSRGLTSWSSFFDRLIVPICSLELSAKLTSSARANTLSRFLVPRHRRLFEKLKRSLKLDCCLKINCVLNFSTNNAISAEENSYFLFEETFLSTN